MAGIFWLASYPKSGNTWMRIFLHNFLSDDDGPADINAIDSDPIASSRDWLDHLLAFDTADLSHAELDRVRPACYEWANREAAQTGYHKVHDANFVESTGGSLISPAAGRGALYLLRNPLDVAPSAASHWGVSIDEAIERMAKRGFGLVAHTDKQGQQVRQLLRDWSGHVLSWVDAPGPERLVVRYEDLLADPVQHFGEVVRFLDLPFDEARLRHAIDASSFRELSRQEQAGGFRERSHKAERFFRSGRSGSWRHTLTDAQAASIVASHGEVMRRFGYLDDAGRPA